MINSMCLVKISEFNGNPDKNGLFPIFLSLVAGTMPNRMVLSGTVAEREQLVVGTTCLVHFVERATDSEYGRQFSVSKLGEVSGIMEVLEVSNKLGDANLVNVDLPTPTGAVEDVEPEVESEVEPEDVETGVEPEE